MVVRDVDVDLPPGQVAVAELPELHPVPQLPTQDDWVLRVTSDSGRSARWSWASFRALRSEHVCVDVHCVEGWSVLASEWVGVPVRALLTGFTVDDTTCALAVSYAGRSASLPVEDLLEMPAWVAFACDGRPLGPERGGPARLLVPHLYLSKSLPWLRALELHQVRQVDSYEKHGYHPYGDPWRDQRFGGSPTRTEGHPTENEEHHHG